MTAPDPPLLASDIPQPATFDVKRLSLGRVDGFLLSQVDGRSTLEDLASLTGLSLADVEEVVVRLHGLGAIRLPGRAVSRKSKAPPSTRGTRATPSRGTRPPPSARGTKPPPSRATKAPPSRGTKPPPSKRTRGSSSSVKIPKDAAPPRDLPPDCVPQLTSRSQRSLAIAMSDAFVLSQIDGTTPVSELAAIAGLDPVAIVAILRNLEAVGAVDLELRAPVQERPSRRGALSVEVFSTPRARRAGTNPGAGLPPKPPPSERRAPAPEPKPRETPRRLSESAIRRPSVPRLSAARQDDDGPCELSAALQAQITERHARLAKATHYELLDVARDADKKAIKRAYFGFVATMHPDRHFGKKLGAFRPKLQEVFVRVTRAYEVLSSVDTRGAYDQTLPRLALPPLAVHAPLARPVVPSVPPPPNPLPQAVPSRGRIRIATGRFKPAYGPVSVSGEQAALSQPSVSLRVPNAAASSPNDAAAGPDSLRRFFSGKVEQDRREKAQVFVEAAEYELAKGNVVAAATHFSLALKACNSPEIRKAYEAVEEQAAARRFEMHAAAASSAERDARWPDAAASYARVYALRPDAKTADRLANAIRLAAGDLREAAKLAEEATRLEPKNGGYRITLGEVYADAGLELRAQAEAKRALELVPAEPRAIALAARVLGKR